MKILYVFFYKIVEEKNFKEYNYVKCITRGKKMKQVIARLFLAVLILVIILGFGIIIFSKSDIFKTNKELFYKYAITENIENFRKIDLETYKNVFLQQKSYEFSGKGKSDALNNFLELDKTISLEINANSDINTNRASGASIFKFGEDELLKIECLKVADKYGIKIAEMANGKYVAVENNNLKDVATKFGISNNSKIPNEIKIISDNEKKLDLRILNEIKEKYVDFLKDQTKDIEFIKEKNTNIVIANEQIKTTKYYIELTERQVYTIICNALEILKADDETLQFYIDYMSDGNIKLEDLKNNIQETIQDFKGKESYYTDENIIKICIYAKNGKAVKTEYIDAYGNSNSITFNSNNSKDEIILETTVKRDIGSSILVGNTVTISLQSKARRERADFDITLSKKYNFTDKMKLKEELGDTADSVLKDFTDYTVKVETDITDISENYAKMSILSKYNDTNIFDFEGELKRGEEYQIADFVPENTIVVNSCSDEDRDNIISTYRVDIIDVLLQKAELVVPGVSLLVEPIIENDYLETPIYATNSDANVISKITIELNNALTQCLNEYIKAYMKNSATNITQYLNEESIKNYCSTAKSITLTNKGVIFEDLDGKQYEAIINTDIQNGYITISSLKEIVVK